MVDQTGLDLHRCDARELLFEHLLFGSPPSAAQEQEDEESLAQHRGRLAQAASCDATIVLRRHPDAHKAVMAVQKAVFGLVAAAIPGQSVKLLGQRLSARFGWAVAVRSSAVLAQGGADAVCMRKLPHSFLVCRPLASVPALEVVVDPAFRKQFQLGRPSRRYEAFLAASVPDIFVGTFEMLAPLIAATAAAIAAAFLELGMPLPPWRAADSLTSRWCATATLRDEACGAQAAIEEELRLLAAKRQPVAAVAAAGAAAARPAVRRGPSSLSAGGAASAPVPWLIVAGFEVPSLQAAAPPPPAFVGQEVPHAIQIAAPPLLHEARSAPVQSLAAADRADEDDVAAAALPRSASARPDGAGLSRAAARSVPACGLFGWTSIRPRPAAAASQSWVSRPLPPPAVRAAGKVLRSVVKFKNLEHLMPTIRVVKLGV